MDFLQKAKDIEAKLAGRFDRTIGGLVGSQARQPLEIVRAIVEAAEQEIQSSGRGRRVFPFNALTVTILAPSRDSRARFESVFADGPPLRRRIVAHLRSSGCSIEEDDLDVTLNYEIRPRKGWRNHEFDIEFARVAKEEPSPPQADPPAPRLEVTVLTGTAERRTYSLEASLRIDVGRCAEVRDSHHRLIRTNHIAFLEGSGDINQSVSRRHAHISYEPESRCFRLHDDGSEHGTGIIRRGRSLSVPRGARGVRLESADEVVLGDARLRVRFAEVTR